MKLVEENNFIAILWRLPHCTGSSLWTSSPTPWQTLICCHEKMLWTDLYSYVETQTARSYDNASRIATTKIVCYVCHHHDCAMYATTMIVLCMSPPWFCYVSHHHDCAMYATKWLSAITRAKVTTMIPAPKSQLCWNTSYV